MTNMCTKSESGMSENREPQASTDLKREKDREGGDNKGMYVGDTYVYDIVVFKCYRWMLLL